MSQGSVVSRESAVRLLVVEDERRLAAALRQGLEAEGFSVELCHNGVEAEVLARAADFDALVLDILLPGQSGYAVCRNLRAAGVTTPILMLTAKDGEYDEADALDLGADDFLAKPFSYVVLVAHLRALLRRGGAGQGPIVVAVGDLVLDLLRRRCTRAGTPVRLTPREFSLLEFLMREPGRVRSKGEILEEVWETDFDGDPNVVEVYIGYLRRKIDVPFARNSIQTVRGAGYRLARGDDPG